MSGHNKWSKIKHKKAATDAQKSKVFSALSKEIIIAAKKGSDLETNFQLKIAVDKAKSLNMPKNNIEKAIKRGSGELKNEAQLEEFLFEAYGPCQVAMLIRAVSDNKNRTLSEIKNLLTKNGGKMVEIGSIGWQFDQVGKIVLKKPDKSEEEMEEILIESGANDFQIDEDEFIIYTTFQELQIVKENLEKVGLIVKEAGLTYLPQNKLELENQDLEKYAEFFDKIEEQDDVVEIYDNIE
jgi:YebC/PmpR family DNA-binding regulatory protein